MQSFFQEHRSSIYPLNCLFFLLCIITTSNPYQPEASSLDRRGTGDLCSITDGRAAIVDNRLFFMSAAYAFDQGAPSSYEPQLYWLNLSSTIPVNGFISPSSLTSVASPSDTLLGEGNARGTFFYDNTMLYAYAGIISSDKNGANNSLWAFNTTTNQWNLTVVEGGNYQFNNNSEGEHTSIPATGQSFYMGGFGVENGALDGLVAFASEATPSWNFNSRNTVGLAPPSMLKGGMEYVRKGQEGVLVAFGGYNTSHQGTTQLAPGWFWSYYSMSKIYVYDIFGNTWYNVTATGDIPDNRANFCTVVTSSPDDSSFQITMYGGWNLGSGQAYDDVYVLTVPSFRWIKIDSQDNMNTSLGSNVGRTRHICDLWGDSQMIVTGGVVTKGTNVVYNWVCNSSYTPFRALDTSTYVWQTEIVPVKNYSVPSAVYNAIGGSATGGATVTSPLAGWGDGNLEGIFSLTVPKDSGNTSNATSPATSSTPSTARSTSTGRHTSNRNKGPIIAGIVTGCFVGFAIVSGVLWWYFRHARMGRSRVLATTTNTERFEKPELSGESIEGAPVIYEMLEARHMLEMQELDAS